MNNTLRWRPETAGASRRGVLLLIVLSMLTLFLMLGAGYLLTTSRAWETSRAYSKLTLGASDNRIPHERMLDRVMLEILRGGSTIRSVSTSGTVTLGTLASGSTESLLADKYGLDVITGTISSCIPVRVSGSAQPLITGSLSLSTAVRPMDLRGRVITFDQPGRPPVSYRILRSGTSGTQDNSPRSTIDVTASAHHDLSALSFPLASSRILINGREFAGDGNATSPNESWDGFDDQNDFLAAVSPPPSGSTQLIVSRGSFLNTQSGTFWLATASGSAQFSLSLTSPTRLPPNYDVDGDAIPDSADNDNDGAVDGAFVDFGLPDVLNASGVSVQLRASALVVPLDGRVNVNLHGSFNNAIYNATAPWPPGIATGSVPLGSGYGPAEINASSIPLLNLRPSENPFLLTLAGGTNTDFLGVRSGGSRFTTGSATYRVSAAGGRYGETAPSLTSATTALSGATLVSVAGVMPLPGTTGTDDIYSRIADRGVPETAPSENYGVPPSWWKADLASFTWAHTGTAASSPRAVFNSPPDLQGRMKTLTGTATSGALAPHLQFVKTEWSSSMAPDSETRDDPYETRFDTRRGFGGNLNAFSLSPASIAIDNPFTLGELEPVLRPYDIDTKQCPPRLTAIFGSAAESCRTEFTTESWDTTAIVGGTSGAAGRIFGNAGTSGWLTSATGATVMVNGLNGTNPLSGLVGGELARGERFNLNRPLMTSGTSALAYSPSNIYFQQRQAYFKDLYTLLVALQQGNGPWNAAQEAMNERIAQWAANVVEFRDADSIMTPFEYDINPRDGWNVDGNVAADEGGDRRLVWGVERPEILLRETFAWENTPVTRGMLVSLHRPWQATAYASGTQTAGEPCDSLLEDNPSAPVNSVDLSKTPQDDPNSYPIWRLRLVAGGITRYIRLDTTTAGTDEFAIASLSIKPTLGTERTLILASGTTVATGTAPTSGTATINTGTPPLFIVNNLSLAAGSGTLFLDRLSDPSTPLPTSTGSATWLADPLTTGSSGTATQRYVAVDSIPVQQTPTSGITVSLTGTTYARDTSNPNEALWKSGTSFNDCVIPLNGVVTNCPRTIASGSSAWFPWANRPFVSAAEIMLVPQRNAIDMLRNYQRITVANQATVAVPISLDLLFDAVHVPTRYAGVHGTTTTNLSADTGIFNSTTPTNQLSTFREPGRVNLNVVTSTNVWNAVVAGALPTPVKSATSAGLGMVSGTDAFRPGRSLLQMLSLSGTGSVVVSDTTTTTASGSATPQSQNVLATDRNPLHTIYTATRLANTVTPRSNVFAVWVTLRESVPNDPDSVRYHRAFYIIDRSIPVAFEPGKDHNVLDCVRVRRVME